MPFARFLKEHEAVEPGQTRSYLYRVGRYLSSARPNAAASPSASRFLEGLARDEEPQHVRQAEQAIKLYSFFQARGPTEPAPITGNTTAPQ